jgi:hypothetical protein
VAAEIHNRARSVNEALHGANATLTEEARKGFLFEDNGFRPNEEVRPFDIGLLPIFRALSGRDVAVW